MAINGFFAGGMAEGMETARKGALEELKHTDDVGLRTRGLDLQERQIARNEQNDLITRADKQVSETMAIVGETIKQGLAVGRDPATIRQAVTPLLQSAQQITQRIGGNPAALSAQVDAMLTAPTGTEAATAAGTAAGIQEGTRQVTAARTITGTPGSSGEGFIIDPKARAEEEGKLRDDFDKRSKDFYVLREFKDRIDTAPSTGAGDVALVFSYMKVLDPTSTVREGEYATAANSGGVAPQIANLYNRLLNGDQLARPTRTQIREAAGKIWEKASERHNTLSNEYASIAKRRGLNPRNIILDNPISPSRRTITTPSGNTYEINP